MSKKGTYRSRYITQNIEDAQKLMDSAIAGVIAGFGEGDDQWAGLDIYDIGASASIKRLDAEQWLIEFIVPIDHLPKNFWFSPMVPEEDIPTFNLKGEALRGEAYQWGLIPKARKRKAA